MNRKIFMDRLRELLKNIPADERDEALAYYESYFDEAGPENERSVVEELESPEKVAETIKKDLFTNAEENPNAVAEPFLQERKEEEHTYGRGGDKTSNVILLIIIGILTFPIWVSAAAVLFGLVVAAFGVLFGGVVGIVAGTAAFLIGGFALVLAGMGMCFAGEAAAGLLTTGAGLLLSAAGVLALLFMVWFCGKIVPMICRGIMNLCRRPFKGKERMV